MADVADKDSVIWIPDSVPTWWERIGQPRWEEMQLPDRQRLRWGASNDEVGLTFGGGLRRSTRIDP
jgi:hypothetical protein